jgi:biofilm PGA synthesis N-glycosyltransferase PgaC
MAPSQQQSALPEDTSVRDALKYVLITPARNEATFIEETIKSVVSQSLPPIKWVIVSDGSTDGTDDIVKQYASQHQWIELVRMPERRERHFAGKVGAFNAGQAMVSDLEYDIIGNLDADITFDSGYFDFLMRKFAANPRLGVAGTPFEEEDRQYDYRFASTEHVSGACQLFRRECFEQIGGYLPMKSGGIDLVAVITARMKGWQTRSFREKTCFHHRKMGSAKHSVFVAAFQGGRADYLLGCDPVWQILRSSYRTVASRPLIMNGALCLAGYVWAALNRAERTMPSEVVRFRRVEERRRLRELLSKAFWGQKFKSAQ